MPVYSPDMFRESMKKTQFYFTIDQIKKSNEKRNKEKNNEINLSGYDKRDMNKMLEKARREESQQFGGNFKGEGAKEEPVKPAENKFFEGKGTTFGGSSSPLKSQWYDGDQDQDTIDCIKMSLKDVRFELLDIPDCSGLTGRTYIYSIQVSRWKESGMALRKNNFY